MNYTETESWFFEAFKKMKETIEEKQETVRLIE